MKQRNGSDLLGPNDPRGASIGIIEVAPTDERKSVLAALLTQEELGRKQVAIVLPQQNKAFQHPSDFDYLKGVRKQLKAQIIFIAPAGPGPAEFARHRRFPVYSSLESFAQALRSEEPVSEEKKFLGIFGLLGGKKHESALAGKEQEAKAPSPATNAPAAMKQAPDPLILGMGTAMAVGGAETMGTSNRPSTRAKTEMKGDEKQEPGLVPAAGGAQEIAPAPQVTTPSGQGADSTNDKQQADVKAPNRGRSSTPVATAMLPASAPEPKPIDLTLRQGRRTQKLPPTASDTASPLASAMQPVQRTENKQAAGAIAGAAGVVMAATPSTSQGGPVRSQSATTGGGSGSGTGTGGAGGRGGGNAGRKRPRRAGILVAALLLLLLTLGVICAVLAYVQPGLAKTLGISKVFSTVHISLPTSDVTITIVPASQTVSNSYIISGVTGTANPQQEQISVRQLSYTTPAATANVTGTGVHTVPATAAHGTLDFINGSTSPYTFGTNTPFTASNGVVFYLDAPVTIPALNLSTGVAGQASGTAHAATPGSAGNIPADAIDIVNTFTSVKNPAAFSGGQDAQHYTFIQQSDVNSAVAQVQPGLLTKAQSGLKAQVQPGEQLVNTAQCSPTVNVSQPVGDQGRNIPSATATVTETCTAEAYKQSDLTGLVQTLLAQKAQTQLGVGYALVGAVVTQTSVQSVKQGTVSLLVNAKGVYAYQFTSAQKEHLASLVVGLSAAQAIAKLESQPGVASASIPNGVTTLPSSVTQIIISVQEPTGFAGGGTAPGGVTPTVTGPGTGTPTPVPGNGSISSPVIL
jgi:hypothetical protein